MLLSELLFGALCGIFCSSALFSKLQIFLPGGLRTNANRVGMSEELQAFFSVRWFSF